MTLFILTGNSHVKSGIQSLLFEETNLQMCSLEELLVLHRGNQSCVVQHGVFCSPVASSCSSHKAASQLHAEPAGGSMLVELVPAFFLFQMHMAG